MAGLKIAPDVFAEIQARLTLIEARCDIRVLFAVESGSRAWGFPSPDSDYDVRFVYARPRDWYLSIVSARDVIELPLDGVYDINGWDVRKALQLLLKPNPVLLEWLESPIFYRRNDKVIADLKALADQVLHIAPLAHHYRRLAEGQWRRAIDGRTEVPLKKYFYVVRPVLALRWLRLNPGVRPPMNLAQLRAGADVPAVIDEILDDLIERKRETKELGNAARLPAIDIFIENELIAAKELDQQAQADKSHLVDMANRVFRATLW